MTIKVKIKKLTERKDELIMKRNRKQKEESMKNKILMMCIVSALCASFMTGCGQASVSDGGTDSSSQTETAQTSDNEKTTDKKSKSRKGKYDNIDADSTPVGVDEIKFSNKNDYTYISGRVYKNSDEPKESHITITFELYDENNNHICNKAIKMSKTLSEGEDVRFEDDIIWEADEKYNKNVPDETLAEYTAKIIDIEETDASDIEVSEIAYNVRFFMSQKNYDKAQILLDDAFKKYPDNVDLKLLQSDLNNAKEKAETPQE